MSSPQPVPLLFSMLSKKNTSAAEQDAGESVEPLDQSLMLSFVGYNARRTFAAIEPYFKKRMAKYNLRPAQFAILTVLKANPDISQRRLADAINVSPPNLAPLLDQLEARDLIVRQRNAQDKRFQTLSLTPMGLQLCSKAEKTVVALELEATKMLTDQEREQLLGLLQKIYLNR